MRSFRQLALLLALYVASLCLVVKCVESDEELPYSLRQQYDLLRRNAFIDDSSSAADEEDARVLKHPIRLTKSSPRKYFSQRSSSSVEDFGGEGLDAEYTVKSVCNVGGKPKVVDGEKCEQLIATGRFKNAINATGWSYLEIETTPTVADADLQAYAAGVLEGVLTRQVLYYHITNTITDYCKGYSAYCKRLRSYLMKNLEYVKGRLEQAAPDDEYWQTVKRSYLQLTGVWDGYQNKSDLSANVLFEIHPVLMINTNGDLIDLEKKFNKTKDPSMDSINGKCSGFVKLTPGNKDILISQVTMSGFQNLLRVLKLYKFGYDKEFHPGHTSTISSYPGMLYSSDDFALLSSGLAVIETTVNVFNKSLNENIQPQGQLHTWVRAIVANSLARSGREWCQIIKRHNSGTYNNQWVVLDYNKFTPGKPLVDHGLLYVLEQMPGYITYSDLTQYLKRKTYYASYNIPFFKSVSKISGFDEQAKKSYWFSWSDCPRSKIFARDHSNVKDLDSLTKLMRYNDYQHEEFSRCECNPPYTAEAAISARGDLNPANGTYPLPGMGHVNHGALDYKGTNYALFQELRFRAWSGPTYENVPAFSWSKFDMAATVKHVGHPDTWMFKPEEYKWVTPVH